jgi:FkbM family methyltransferase
MVLKRLSQRLNCVFSSSRPFKFIVSRILWHSQLCRFFKIKCKNYVLRFYPSALSASMWLDPNERRDDDIFLAAYLKEGDVVLDIGANIGTVALESAALTGCNGRIFAFEPHPRIFKYLNSNIKINNFKNIETFNTALGDHEGTIMLTDNYSDDQNKVQLDSSSRNIHKISIRPLDNILIDRLMNIDRIALMKIDVEGYELFVIRGARKILSRCECVYIESYEEHFNKYGYTTSDMLNILENNGFYLYKRNDGRFMRINLPYVSDVCENIFALRKTGSKDMRRA